MNWLLLLILALIALSSVVGALALTSKFLAAVAIFAFLGIFTITFKKLFTSLA